MRCSNCSKDIDESVFPPPLTYCPYCGLKLKDSGGEETEGMHFCSHCGREIPGRVSFCPYCGGEIGRRMTSPPPRLDASQVSEYRAKPGVELPPEQKKKSAKLYKQWVKFSNLPPDAVPSTETPKERPARQYTPATGKGNGQRLPLLYILLGVGIVIVIVTLTIILTKSC